MHNSLPYGAKCKINEKNKNFLKKVLTIAHKSVIIDIVDRKRSANMCESGGIGRRARLRGVWATVRVQVPSFAPFILPDCVKVAQQTLTLFVWVRILVRQPKTHFCLSTKVRFFVGRAKRLR